MSRKDYPIIGYVTVPVRAWTLEKEGEQFQCGSAFWWGGDCTADAEDDNYTYMVGGNFGGGWGYSVTAKDKKNRERYYGEIFTEDLYTEVDKLIKGLTKEDVIKAIEAYNKVKEEKNNIRESQQAAKEVVEEKPQELELEHPYLDESVPDEKEPMPEPDTNPAVLKDSRVIMINDNGWEKDWNLDEKLPEEDYYLLGEPYHKEDENKEPLLKIPFNLGCGMTYKNMYEGKQEEHYYTEHFNDNIYKNRVILEIDSWVGISAGAVHIYGTLNYNLVESRPQNDPKCSTSFGPNILSSMKIKLTRYVTKRDIKDYPDNFKERQYNTRTTGFYSKEVLRNKAIETFNKIFDKGWELELDNGKIIKHEED